MELPETTQTLLALSHDLGRPERELAILGEGNTSARLGEETFLVKASGSTLASLDETGLVECRFAPLLAMLEREEVPSDEEIEEQLFGSRVDPAAKKPSVEALFHAYLLSLPGVNYAGHTHSIAINGILCTTRAPEFAARRMFPDEIVCCGPASALVPYTDPGLRLCRKIREAVSAFSERHGQWPRVILLENHGIITFGATPEVVKAAMFMADKAARIFVKTSALGGPRFLSEADVDRIANRIDEHYRRRALNL